MTAASIPFAKMNGIGNSILVVDLRGSDLIATGALAQAAHAEPALSFDQLMAIGPARQPGTAAYVDIFNNDGSRAGACGNGTRCVAWALLRGSAETDLVVETGAGRLPCHRLSEWMFSVDMGPPRFGWADIPLRWPVADTRATPLADGPASHGADLSRFSAVSMGNPHAVFFVPDIAAVDLARLGPALEHHAIFPDRANISFAKVVDRGRIRLRVWERGAGATLACGSAACAVTVAGVRAGLTDRTVDVTLPGGTLTLVWRETDSHVVMTGAVELEHHGVLPARVVEAGR